MHLGIGLGINYLSSLRGLITLFRNNLDGTSTLVALPAFTNLTAVNNGDGTSEVANAS